MTDRCIIYTLTKMNKRRAKVFRSGSGLVLVIPRDWAEGMNVAAGDELELWYDGELLAKKIEPKEEGA